MERGLIRNTGVPAIAIGALAPNRLIIRQDRLEEQLLRYFQEQVLTTRMIEYTVQPFENALQQHLAEIQASAEKHSLEAQRLRDPRKELEEQAGRLATAIAQMGHSATLLSRVAGIEKEMALVDQQLQAQRLPDVSVSIGEIRKFMASNITDIRTLLLEVPSKAKQKLMEQVGTITLTPQIRPPAPVMQSRAIGICSHRMV